MNSLSRSIVTAANAVIEKQDAKGRTLKIKRLNALDRLRLLKAAGPDLSQNDGWLNMAALAVSVQEIDGVPRAFPATERQIEGLVADLGDPGLLAVVEALEQDGDESLLFDGPPVGNSGHASLTECLYLVRNGVPFDVAFALSDNDRHHFIFVLQNLDEIP